MATVDSPVIYRKFVNIIITTIVSLYQLRGDSEGLGEIFERLRQDPNLRQDEMIQCRPSGNSRDSVEQPALGDTFGVLVRNKVQQSLRTSSELDLGAFQFQGSRIESKDKQ